MKKLLITTIIISATLSLMAQQNGPVIFHNQLEKRFYEMEHPSLFQNHNGNSTKAFNEFNQKLDSVVGSNDFDWTRFKNHFAYDENGNCTQELSFEWNNAWIPTVKSVNSFDENGNETLTLSYQIDENGEWITASKFEYFYNAASLIDSMVYSTMGDSTWVLKNKREYFYDADNQIVENTYYVSNAGVWSPNNKYEYTYNAEGKLIMDLYYTQRNGTWRESSKDTLIYNADGNCELLLSMRKGMGPQGNSWRNSYKYEFVYDGAQLMSELYYLAGWSSSDMTLDSRNDYQYDANGNLTLKTASIFNGEEWIVRDTYDNLFDPNLNANKVMGMEDYWNSYTILAGGNLQDMPIFNNWQYCAISSSNLDTEFTLYCSGFAGVEDNQVANYNIHSDNGILYIESETNHDITIFDLTGRTIASRNQASNCQFNLKPGIYVVKVGNISSKVIVR